MARIILLIAIGLVAFIAWQRFQRLSGPDRKKYAWQVLAITGGCVLLLLVVTGRLHWLGAALAAAIPVARRLLPLALPWLAQLRPGFLRRAPAADQNSSVDSAILSMQLDHNTGQISGTVLSGTFAGSSLEELNETDLLALYQYCCGQDQDSARLLQTYLDQRLGSEWHASEQARTSADETGAMSREEALAILGLDTDADREQILQAHRRLIQKLHPDRGGNDYLAAQLNRARDALLS